MTVSSQTSRVGFNGDDSTTSVPITFRFLDNSHIRVVHRSAAGVETTWALNTQYTLTGAGNANGGTLTVSTSPTDYTPASGETLTVLRNVPITQETDYVENDPFPAETHEGALDKLTMVAQQQTEQIGRSITFTETSTASGVTFPDLVASAIIKYNSAGTALEAATLASLSATLDTSFVGLTTGQFLQYDGSNWTNITLDLDGISGVDLTTAAPASGDLLYYDGTNWVPKTPAEAGALTREVIAIACSDEESDLTTGTAKVTFRMPYAFTLTAVRASVTTAPVGATVTVDINEGGTTILSTELTIDASEKTSTTAAVAAVISDSSLADDAEITIDIDQVGSSTAGKGLKVYLIGYRTA
jgi:hypothetical protein